MLLLPLLLFCAAITAQDHLRDDFVQINFSERDAFSFVRCLAQDHEGFIWIGSNYGLYRYDGYESIKFRHDPGDVGSLSDNFVNTLHIDSRGRLWVGTESGLDLLDRSAGKFMHFVHDPEDHTTLSNNRVSAIQEDHWGNIWIGTRAGLNLLTDQKGQFKRFYSDPEKPGSLSGNEIRCLYRDNAGNLWIGTYRDGLNRLILGQASNGGRAPDSIHFEHYKLSSTGSARFLNGTVNNIFEDRQGRLWLSYGGTLQYFDPDSGGLKWLLLDDMQSSHFSRIWAMGDDNRNMLWIGTHGNGLYRLSLERFANSEELSSLESFAPHPMFFLKVRNGIESHPFSRVWTIFEDRDQNLWIGGMQGLLRKDNGAATFQLFSDPTHPEVRFNDQGLTEDHRGNILFSNKYTHELYTLDPVSRQIDRVLLDTTGRPTQGVVYVSALERDHHNGLWVGTNEQGMYYIDSNNNVNEHFLANLNTKQSGTGSIGLVSKVYEDQAGDIWIATWRDGLKRYDPENGTVEHFLPDPADPSSLQATRVNDIFEDSRGDLWFGTYFGLSLFNREKRKFIHFTQDSRNPHTISHNRVNAIFEDSRGNFWVGTEGGLNLMNREEGTFIHFLERDGLANDMINDIIEDGSSNLWLCTQGGLASFDPLRIADYKRSGRAGYKTSDPGFRENLFRSYTFEDGLQSQSYPIGLLSSRTGELYVVGENGLEHFHPDSLRRDTLPPQVVVTALHRSHRDEQGASVDYFVADSAHLTFSYRDTILSFEVAALTYRNAKKIRYRYQLEGFSDHWFDLGFKRQITFTDLDPGKYILRVMAVNGDGVWSRKATTIFMQVLPPWWADWWARAGYVLLLIASIRWVWLYERRRHQAQAEAHRLKELDAHKTRLYTNITHEFRTPLTIILGIADQIRDDPQRWYREGLEMIGRNGRQLLKLVNQMLDLSKLDKGKLALQLQRGDIIAFLQYLVQSFESLAAGKQIRVHFLPELETLEMDFDPDQLMKVVSNLLSNAIKFTPDAGEVYVMVRQSAEQALELRVRDTGIGIAQEDVPHIFDRFFQANAGGETPNRKQSRGVGVGLALCRELVDLMGGTITVKSRPGEGAEFCVGLPIKKDPKCSNNKLDYRNVIKFKAAEEGSIGSGEIPFTDGVKALSTTKPEENIVGPPTILLIEDHRDVLLYLASCLESDYQLEVARDGREGIALALELVPDIIISDVMMPRKDGLEVCATLKNDVRTSHIPIILLTAKTEQEAKMEGLQAGADAYLTKPFERPELMVRIRKLLELRLQLQRYYRQSADVYAMGETGDGNREDRFLQQLRQIMLDHLAEEDFGIAQLCREIGLGRSQLHNKLKALTGQSASIYIRSIRLEKAAALLRTTNLNVSEVAYRVGFRTAVYFSQTFSEAFGVSPTQYRKGGESSAGSRQ